MSNDTFVDDLFKFMKVHWRMMKPHEPQLVISVTGGAKDFHLSAKQKERFNTGLINEHHTAVYKVNPVFKQGEPAALNPNHTHFLLIYDGFSQTFRDIEDFRTELE
ncbi:transient receptor potential cation channel subfamily M member 6-like [Tachypleus tridentatus]|uniref:transient receptor potential cation channel subfamily M member 6-like n=1 Tax=Tachypleus tridentatus TaxID=6853 RepID=UPI003FD23EFA